MTVFFFLSKVPVTLLGCTIAAVSDQRTVKHVKNVLQNIMTEWEP